MAQFGPKSIAAVSADGLAYYINSITFLSGKLTNHMWNVPSYSYLLALIIKLFGFQLTKALIIQGAICSLIPVVMFFISREVFNYKVAIIASLCGAFSYQLIHYSVVVHRNGFAALTCILSVLILIKLINKFHWKKSLLLGFFIGWTVLLDGIMAPIAFIFLLVGLKYPCRKTSFKYFIFFLTGFLIAQTSFNWIIYRDLDSIYLLGRHAGNSENFTQQWNNAGYDEGRILSEMNFDPMKNFGGSLLMVLTHPIEVGSLLAKKCIKEIISYFLDHDTFIFDPAIIAHETYFSSAVMFFYFPVMVLGIFVFLFSKNYNLITKLALGSPLFWAIFAYSFHTGIARYRAVIQPIILIFFAKGLYFFWNCLTTHESGQDKQTHPHKSHTKEINQNIYNKNILSNTSSRLVLGCFISFVCITMFWHIKAIHRPPYYPKKPVTEIRKIIIFKSNESKTSFHLNKNSHYNIYAMITKQFGPSQTKEKMKIFINKNLVAFEDRIKPGWFVIKNVSLKTGDHNLNIRLTRSHSKPKKRYSGPLTRQIIIRKIVIVES